MVDSLRFSCTLFHQDYSNDPELQARDLAEEKDQAKVKITQVRALVNPNSVPTNPHPTPPRSVYQGHSASENALEAEEENP